MERKLRRGAEMRPWRVPYPKFGKGPALKRVTTIAARLGLDLAAFGAQGAAIVGSNGKGSTAAMTAALLEQRGASVGLFTSPHLFDLNERFRIDGEDIADEELQRCWDRVAAAAEAADQHRDLGGFEFLFLIAADWFAARKCAHTVWEAGIGGRFDPVRLIQARRVALTALDFEHTELLGGTLAQIALDKADAAPAGAALYVSESCAPLFATIEEHCVRRGVQAEIVPAASLGEIEPPLAGPHQRRNAALALALADAMTTLDEDTVRKAFAAVRWPGRLEALSEAPLVVIDVGHTPDAIDMALRGFERLRGGRRALLVCGVSRDKNLGAIVGALAPAFSTIVCAAASHKGAPPAQIAAHASAANPQAELVLAENVADARRLALTRAGDDGAVYVAGGLFLAAEFRAAHLGRDSATLVFF
jgi:dihydrofolate synthase/folylpolyglutamate synthase